MRTLLLLALFVAFPGYAATLPKCKPPARAGALLGMQGCLQPDGSLVTEKGFRIRLAGSAGGGGGGGGVEIDPPSGSGFAEIDRTIERDADALQKAADAPDAGLERHTLREAARFQREMAESIRQAQESGSPVSSPKPGAAPTPNATPPVPAALEKWCADLLPVATRASREFATPLPTAAQLPPIPAPPAADFWDCWACDRQGQERYERSAREWVEKEWEGKYLELERAAVRAAIEFGKFEEQPDVQQALAQPGSACAALGAPGLGLRGGMQGRMMAAATARMDRKLEALSRQFGKPAQYPLTKPVGYAYFGTRKEISLLRCEEAHPSTDSHFLQEQLAEIHREWSRRLYKEKDFRQLANTAFILSMDKERFLLSLEQMPEDHIENLLGASLMEVKIDFQVKLAGQSAGAGGYVRARSKGKAILYPYIDSEDGRCPLLAGVEVNGALQRPTPMALNVFDGEMYGPKLRNKYLGPDPVYSNVVVELPCCDKNKPQDQAVLYLEALGAQQSRGETEQWSQPGYAPFPAIDNWFRLAFNTAAMMKSVNSGEAQAESAQMQKEMDARQVEFDDLKARYERGEASLADMLAGAMKMKDEALGGSSLGKNSMLTQALHYRLEVPFQNNQRYPVNVKLDARNLLRGGGSEAQGVLDNLAYGFGDVELKLVNSGSGPPPPKVPPKSN
ncbi:MAG TPA: hypothetical protein VM074_01465 [Solimonas sp.]|nr:hypothetical protein [Solimonas sp.]